MRLILTFIVMLLLSGCVSTPGYINTRVSEFDGSTEYSMTPAWVCKENIFDGCSIKLGLHRTSKMPPDQLILVVQVDGIRNILGKDSLKFNIDGTIVAFTAIDFNTEIKTNPGIYQPGFATRKTYVPGYYIPPSDWSSIRYIIDKEFLKTILNANKVAVRVELPTSYLEGIFSKDGATLARPAFKEFYDQAYGEPNSVIE